MLIKLPLVAMICYSTIAVAQQKNLYLIVGKDYQICQARPFPIQLLRVNQNRLDTVEDFIKIGPDYYPGMDIDEDSTDRPLKIGIYHNLNIAVVFTRNIHEEKFNFYIINFAKELKIDTIQRSFPEECITNPTFYMVDIDNTLYIIIKQVPKFFEKDNTEVFRGITLFTHRDTVFTTNVVTQYLLSEGEQGIAINESTDNVSEIMWIQTWKLNSRIINPISYPRLANKELALFNMPDTAQFYSLDSIQRIPQTSPDEFFPLLIVNKQFIVCKNNQEWNFASGGQIYSIFDVEKHEWHETPFIKGFTFAGVRQFGSWLAGHVTFEHQWGYQQKIKKYGEIPGKRYRPQTCKYGFTFDERANMFEQFPVGTLYLYNMKTYKYMEWDALENGEHQGDSEIILVQDNTVYYRINDKIYKAPIINGEKLGEPVLLVTDPRVPDIHWAFLAKDQSSASPDIK